MSLLSRELIFRPVELRDDNDPLSIAAALLALKEVWKCSDEQLAALRDPARALRDRSMLLYNFHLLEDDGRGIYDPGRLVAVGGLCVEGSYADLNHVAVATAYRRQGYGRLLISNLEGIASVSGAEKVTITTPNYEAIAFWQSVGYEQFNDGDLAMEKSIQQTLTH